MELSPFLAIVQWVDLPDICIKATSLLAIVIEIILSCPLSLWSKNRPAVLKRYVFQNYCLKMHIFQTFLILFLKAEQWWNRYLCTFLFLFPFIQQCPSGFAHKKSGRQQVMGWIPSHACRLNRSQFSAVFSETCINTD